jgi:DNA-binding LacI/PurR family transcriptional regulator
VVHLAGRRVERGVARIEGWRAELQAGGSLPAVCAGVATGPPQRLPRRAALAREKDVTAVFAANDQMALGLCAALREQGCRVPDDVSIVGFDDVPEAEYFAPPLDHGAPGLRGARPRAMVLVERVLAARRRRPSTWCHHARGPRSTAPPALTVRHVQRVFALAPLTNRLTRVM